MKMDKPRHFVELMEKMVKRDEVLRLGEITQKRIKHVLKKKTFISSLISKFPKKQKKLLLSLADGHSKDRKELMRLVGTTNLKSLVRDTRLTIKKFGYRQLLIIKVTKGTGSLPKYYYSLIATMVAPTSDK